MLPFDFLFQLLNIYSIYFKDNLPLIRKTGITRLSECLVCELQFSTKKCIIALLYRHILPNSSSCIDLIFTNEPGLVTSSGVHPSLFPRCHHKIIYTKVNFKVHVPPACSCKVWNYTRANVGAIRASLSSVDWSKTMSGLHVDDQLKCFTDYLLNIFNNFVPNHIITVKEKDGKRKKKKKKKKKKKEKGKRSSFDDLGNKKKLFLRKPKFIGDS